MLDALHEATKANDGAGFESCLVQYLNKLAPVNLQVWRAELFLCIGRKPVPVEDRAVTIGPETDFLRNGSIGLYGLEDTPISEDLCRVGAHLNARADLDITAASILTLGVYAKTWIDVIKHTGMRPLAASTIVTRWPERPRPMAALKPAIPAPTINTSMVKILLQTLMWDVFREVE
jgi:hypothetical protein